MPKITRKFIWSAIFGILAISGLLLLNIADTPSQKTTEHNTVISDASAGLNFKISKEFENLNSTDLKDLSPHLLYGFKPVDVERVACLVSQTQRPKSDKITADYLIAGTYAELKKSNPDVKLEYSKGVEFENGVVGALLRMSYKEGSSNIKRLELVATTDKRTTFAYCYSPSSLYEHYLPVFEGFISSITIN